MPAPGSLFCICICTFHRSQTETNPNSLVPKGRIDQRSGTDPSEALSQDANSVFLIDWGSMALTWVGIRSCKMFFTEPSASAADCSAHVCMRGMLQRLIMSVCAFCRNAIKAAREMKPSCVCGVIHLPLCVSLGPRSGSRWSVRPPACPVAVS